MYIGQTPHYGERIQLITCSQPTFFEPYFLTPPTTKPMFENRILFFKFLSSLFCVITCVPVFLNHLREKIKNIYISLLPLILVCFFLTIKIFSYILTTELMKLLNIILIPQFQLVDIPHCNSHKLSDAPMRSFIIFPCSDKEFSLELHTIFRYHVSYVSF